MVASCEFCSNYVYDDDEEEYRSSQMDELVHYWGEPGTPTEFLSALFVKGEKEKNSEENLKDLRSLMDELD